MSYNPLIIANKIVRLKNNNLTIMELLKLLYIAHGYSLAILKTPLFDGEVEAWPYGPVVREVYRAFRTKGIVITSELESLSEQSIDPSHEEILKKVVDIYTNKSGWELSMLTHEENSPWTKIVASQGFYSKIPDDLTKSYYEGLIFKNAQ